MPQWANARERFCVRRNGLFERTELESGGSNCIRVLIFFSKRKTPYNTFQIVKFVLTPKSRENFERPNTYNASGME